MLTEFDGSVIPPNQLPNSGNVGTSEVTIGMATLHIDDVGDRVQLHATIVWANPREDGNAEAVFSIFRNGTRIFGPLPGGVVGHSAFNATAVTSFTFLDKTPLANTPPSGLVFYELKGSAPAESLSFVIREEVVFTAAEIEANNPTNP